MIYVLTEQFMNGTVTMDIMTTGIEAESFEEACGKLYKFKNWDKAENIKRIDDCIRYTIGQSDGLLCTGRMRRLPLEIR